MQKWRLIKTINTSGQMQMAIDEAIATLNKTPTLRFYKWTPSCVSIGYFQDLEKEINVEKCYEQGIDFVRRYTGGGAVFHEKELTYSISLPEDLVSKDIMQSYRKLCNILVKGFYKLGLVTEFKEINDIIMNGKKISGNAQTRKNGILLQHGTVLLEVDVDKMFSLLKVPNEKIRDKMIESVKERVTGINMGYDLVRQKMIEAFEEAFNIKVKETKLSKEEEELAKKLYREKYSTKEWNYGNKL
ncbi:lipoate--protein ligase family protein [Candidatus Woesearchaeota archaeon]|nr:lipoate--protein ligase family protein [Candidatus Woesearchaeota archaeon]